MRSALDTLARLITPPSTALRMRTARVAAATSTRVTITLGGSNVSVPFLSTYTPAVGDTVLVLQTEAGVLVVLGKTA